MHWSDIPSLAALRAFEAAARTGSLSAAARELNVTHAAISQHVRTLETRFGRPLLSRDGQRMVPSEAGAALAKSLGDGFTSIHDAVRRLDDLDRTRPLRIALTPTLAESWLMPRLRAFWSAHPEIELELIPGEGLVDLRRDSIDLAIRYGRGGWPGSTSEVLLSARAVAAAAPGLIGDRPRDCFDAFLEETFIFDGHRAEERLWLAENGVRVETASTRLFATAQLAREAAISGLGITVLPEPLLRPEIEGGRLAVICRQSDSELNYHMLHRPEAMTPALRTLMRWLRAAAQED